MLTRVRGKASQYNCAGCGGPAKQWAYDHADPDEKNGEHAFSLKPEHYDPLCLSCHSKRDYIQGNRTPCMAPNCNNGTLLQLLRKA